MNAQFEQAHHRTTVSPESVAIHLHRRTAPILLIAAGRLWREVHLVTNGFIMLDKIVREPSRRSTMARASCRMDISLNASQFLTKSANGAIAPFIDGGLYPGLNHHGFAGILTATAWALRHPKPYRRTRIIRSFFKAKAPGPEMAISAIQILGDRCLQRSIDEETLRAEDSDGYLINDLPFCPNMAIVQMWTEPQGHQSIH